ncbi:MAG: BamA/TamA family outer membrane protein [Deltaproteobacteria bacterium]|nr:BamA/TamA family outer membrane protein [Deltaproteobacteria bacterium]
MPRSRSCLLAVVATCAACASIPRGRDGVDELDLEGVEQVDEDQLRERIATQERGSFLGIQWPWTEWPLYDRAILRRDLERIERFYRARGYYDTQVGTPRVDREEEDDDRGVVTITIPIEEGLPVAVRSTNVLFEPQPAGVAQVPVVIQERIRRAFPLHVGDVLDEEEYEAAKTRLLDAMHEASYASAVIQGDVRVDPRSRRADVVLRVRAGPVYRFGRVEVSGTGPLPRSNVSSLIEIERGTLYRASVLRDVRNELYDIGVFATVRVTPVVLETERRVDVRVEVTPGRLQRLRLGVGAAIEPERGDVHLVSTYEHRNFLGGLRRVRAEVQPRLLFDLSSTEQELTVRPGVLASIGLRRPGFFERRTWLATEARYDVGPHPSDASLMRHLFNVSLGLERSFGELLFGTTSINYELYLPISYEAADEALDEALIEPWAFPYLQETLRFDTRNDPLRPRRGVLLSANLQQAGFVVPSTWDYLRFGLDMRAYVQPIRGTVLALRGAIGFLRTFDGPDGGPISKRFFVGGANSVRGYGFGRAGSRAIDCRTERQDAPAADGETPPPSAQRTCSEQNLGGTASWELGLEIRQTIVGDFGVVVFADAGDADIDGSIRPDYLHFTLGMGLRYYTIIGPIRFDVGWRVPGAQRVGGELPNDELEPDLDVGFAELPISFHLAIGEAF